MTKSDYFTIATIISAISDEAERVRVRDHFARELRYQSVKFNVARFVDACCSGTFEGREYIKVNPSRRQEPTKRSYSGE